MSEGSVLAFGVAGVSAIVSLISGLEWRNKSKDYRELEKHKTLSPGEMHAHAHSSPNTHSAYGTYGIVRGTMSSYAHVSGNAHVYPYTAGSAFENAIVLENSLEEDVEEKVQYERKEFIRDPETKRMYTSGSSIHYNWNSRTRYLQKDLYGYNPIIANVTNATNANAQPGYIKLNPEQYWKFTQRRRIHLPQGFTPVAVATPSITPTTGVVPMTGAAPVTINNNVNIGNLTNSVGGGTAGGSSDSIRHVGYFVNQSGILAGNHITAIGQFKHSPTGDSGTLTVEQNPKKPYYLSYSTPEEIVKQLKDDAKCSKWWCVGSAITAATSSIVGGLLLSTR